MSSWLLHALSVPLHRNIPKCNTSSHDIHCCHAGTLFPCGSIPAGIFITYSILMNGFYKTKFIFLFAALVLLKSVGVYAEGSKDLYPSGAGGGRACLVSTNATKGGWPLTNTGVHYAYVKAGEQIGAASSAVGIGSGQVILTAPDGTVYSSTVGATTNQIPNRAKELEGPWVGYTPFTRTAGAGQTGLWKIEFISTSGISVINESVGTTWYADEAWIQSDGSSAICAWDASVRSAGGVIITGRVFTNVLNMYVTRNDYRGKLFVKTKDGYTFKVNNNGLDGLGFVTFVNNKGLTTNGNDNDLPLYKSVAGTRFKTDFFTWDPRADDGASSFTHKMFYQLPASDLPVSSNMSGGKSTWLNPVKIKPEITNITVTGVEGTPGQVSRKGANITFNASITGTFRLSIEGSGSFVTRKITGIATAGANTVYWDGKDGAGVMPTLGTSNVNVKVQLQGSEIHFPYIDVETNRNGLIIERLADNNVTVEDDVVFWADSAFAVTVDASNPLINGNEGSGVSSNTNGHKWGNNFGNDRTMDTWTYVLGEVATTNTSVNVIVADLAVTSIGPKTSGTTQTYAGQTIQYQIVVTNNGPSDVTGATLNFKPPAGVTLSNVTMTSGCATLSNSSATNGWTSLINMPNGCIATFTVDVIPDATMVGKAIQLEASIMRPKDVTDPDATNPDATAIPTDPHLECKNGGTTETCNNIKYNSAVTVLPSADIIVTKQTQNSSRTTYFDGETVNYVFTVRNAGPGTATNVNVLDNAPAGTTITAWTASATAGIFTLPNATGTGNINETIASMPSGAEATYVVAVKLPVGYNATLSNTASATATSVDGNPANNTSTTPGLTLYSGDVSITKTTTATNYVPGRSVTYIITVKNNGPTAANSVNVKDNAPAGTTISSWTAAVTTGSFAIPATSGTGNLDQTIATIPDNGVVTYTVTVNIPSGFTAALHNTATATTNADNDNSNNTATTPDIPAAPEVDLNVQKVTAYTTFAPGEDVIYTVSVKNNGVSDAKNVRIVDNAPVGTSITIWNATVTAGTVTLPATSGTGDLDQTITALPAGAEVMYVVRVTTPLTFTGTLSNTAQASSSVTDANPSDNTSTTPPMTPTPKADVSVTKLTAATKYVPGTTVLYTITVTNNGPNDATDAHVQDDAPAGTMMGNWTAVVTSGIADVPVLSGMGNIDQVITTLPKDAVVTYTVEVNVPSSFTGNLSNTATANAATSDPVAGNNSSTTAPIIAGPEADLQVVKTTDSTTFAPGEEVVYKVRVTNNGPSDAKNVRITDNAPAGTTINGWTATVINGTTTLPATSGTGNLNQTIASMPNGDIVEYTITVKTSLTFTGTLSNTATVSSDATDNNNTNNSNTTTGIVPTPKADVTVTKSTAAAMYVPGGTVTYSIVVKNNGPNAAASVRIQDVAPTGTTIGSWTAVVTAGTVTLPATSGAGNLDQTIASLPKDAIVTYTVVVNVPVSFSAGLHNTAFATTTTKDVDVTNNSSTTPDIPATDIADVTVTKSTTATSYVPGKTVNYSIVVKNNGPNTATNVRVQDTPPSDLSVVSWTAAVTAGSVTLPATSGINSLDQTIAALPKDAIVTYEVVMKAASFLTGNLTNTAVVSTPTVDIDNANNSSTTPGLPAAPAADLSVVKTTSDASQTTYTPGTDIKYDIILTNNGPSYAHNISIKDKAPTGTTMTAWKATVLNGSVAIPVSSGSGDLDLVITDMPDGAIVKFEVTLHTDPSFKGNVRNRAVVTSDTQDDDPSNDVSVTPDLTPVFNANVELVKTLSDPARTSYKPGDNVMYKITVTNYGPGDAEDLNVKDIAPAGTIISGWGVRTLNGIVTLPDVNGTGNLDQTIAVLPAGAILEYQVAVRVPLSYIDGLINTATVSSSTPDATPDNNASATPAIVNGAVADISVTKTLKDASQTTFTPGGIVEYLITVKNNGPDAAGHVKVKDIAPAGTKVYSWRAGVISGSATLSNIIGQDDLDDEIIDMDNGAVVQYEVTLQIDPDYSGTSLINSAAVNAPATDPAPGNNTAASPSLSADPVADMSIEKVGPGGTFIPGQEVTYNIYVKNFGPSAAKNVNIKDFAPAGTTISRWNANTNDAGIVLPNTSGTGDVNETIATLPSGGFILYTVSVLTTPGFRGDLTNTATVGSTTRDEVTSNNSSTSTPSTAVPSADLYITKTLKNAQQTFRAGEEVAYIISITNNGPGEATNVNIVDVAPKGTTITSWTASVVAGTVTLPNAGGTGNLNETIPLIPDQASIAYEVIVKTPEDYTGKLVNAVTVTGAVPDPTPDCDQCTSPSVIAEPLPVADTDNSGDVRSDNPVVIPVLKNDKPGNDNTPLDPASLEIVEQPAHGTVIVKEDGTVVYTPEEGYTGPDSFTYRVKDVNGNRSNVATVNVNIIPNEVEVPNVITPNGDGSNDKLVIKGLEKFVQNEIVIYNRWNNVLFRKQHYNGEWDGQGLNAGTYYYTLKGQDASGQWHTYNGYIMLLR